jgi:hypothetical protein
MTLNILVLCPLSISHLNIVRMIKSCEMVSQVARMKETINVLQLRSENLKPIKQAHRIILKCILRNWVCGGGLINVSQDRALWGFL